MATVRQTVRQSALQRCSPSFIFRTPVAAAWRRLHSTELGMRVPGGRPSLRPSRTSAKMGMLFVSSPFRRSYFETAASIQASYYSAKTALWSLILANTGVYLTWYYAAETKDVKLTKFMNENALLTPANLAAGRYHTLITSAFSHKQFGHFAFNMFGLWTFGGLIAYIPGVGAMHVFSLALTSAIASSVAWLAHQKSKGPTVVERKFGPLTTHRTYIIEAALGASGVVMATSAVATCLMPMTRMLILGVVPAPLFVTTGLFVAADFYMLESQSTIGHSAHLGGFVCGVAYYLLLLRKRGGIWHMIRRR